MQSIARRQKIGRMTHWIECPNDRWIRQIVALCGNGRKNVNVRGVSVRLIDIIVQQVHINNVQGAIRIAVVPLVPHIPTTLYVIYILSVNSHCYFTS